ncbi:MAG: nucleotidyl transferase AbiEii/AbiGii toxin family protein [Elusimicrobiota bacterium]
MVEIFNDDMLRNNLAFRGGTALHKLYLKPAARYSEDIDLVQIKAAPIGPIFDRLKKLSFTGGKIKREQKNMNNVLTLFYDSEIPPVIQMKLKIEINCREHVPAFIIEPVPLEVQSKWYTGKTHVMTYTLEELLGTKIRALYQRRKGRDLFDLWYAIKTKKPELTKIVKAFYSYINLTLSKISRVELINNVEAKLKNMDFRNDMTGLIRPEIKYDIDNAWEFVKEKLVPLI